DGGDDEERGEDAESQEQRGEVRVVPLLERIVEEPLPLVQQHEQVHDAEAEEDDGAEQQPGSPALLGEPVWPREAPDLGQKRGRISRWSRCRHESSLRRRASVPASTAGCDMRGARTECALTAFMDGA